MSKCLTVMIGGFLLALSWSGPAPAQSKKVQEYLKDLKDKNPKVRILGAQEIGKLAAIKLSDAKTALPALKEALKDTDPGVRKAVIEALGQIEEEKDYVPILIDALKRDKDAAVQLTCITALTQIGPDEAKSALPVLQDLNKGIVKGVKDTVQDPQGVRLALLNALLMLDKDPKKVVPLCSDVLKRDKNVPVRLAAVKALADAGPAAKPAIAVLQQVQKEAKALKDKDMGLMQETETALQKIQGKK